MNIKKSFAAATMLAGTMTALSFMSAGAAQAQGALVMYCAVQEEWCRATVGAFERETGIKVSMTRKSSGEIFAQRSEEHTSELQSRQYLVCRLLLEKKKNNDRTTYYPVVLITSTTSTITT